MNGALPESAIEFLVIDDSPNATESRISALRNTGMVAHYTRVNKEEELVEALTNPDIDLILYTIDAEAITPKQVIALCRKTAPQVPLIILYTDDQNSKSLIEAMHKGVRDVVLKDDIDHLEIVVNREYDSLQGRRELKRLQSRMQEMEEQCDALVEHSRDAIAYVHEGMYIRANQVYLDMFGYLAMDDIEGMPILDMVSPKDIKAFKKFLRSLDDSKEAATLEIRCQNSEGKEFSAKLETCPASIDSEPCTQIIIRDQSLDKELEQKISVLNKQDSHTGLANRQHFIDSLNEATSKQGKAKAGSLHYILLDSFQKLRTQIGIGPGDTVLLEIAKILQSNISKTDVLARFGDHTFVILSPKDKPADAEKFAEKLRTAITNHSYSEQLPDKYNITCSIGISYLTSSTEDSQALINQAFNACELIRNEGGNGVASYSESVAASAEPEQSEEGAEDNETKELIKGALENDRFRLLYQPIVSLQGDTRENYAVLLRLLDEDDEELLPGSFLEQAAQVSLMAEIDRWVIENSIKELAKQRELGHKVKFFINISAAGIADETLLLWICDCLRENNAKGAWLTFQIRDCDLRTNTLGATKLAEGLKKVRCQLAVDQFGLNPKAETTLKHLPVDYIKIDPSFTHGLASSEELQDKLHEINQVAQKHNVKSIAMAVEDANSLAVLWTVGINYIQGHFLQKPSRNITYDFNSM
jgi:diguanylate cyclase (GGDEF)-like protein/PAS domain S-box-containing protein